MKKPEEDERERYRSIAGSLMYLANTTRPDLCMAATISGSYIEDSSEAEWLSTKRTLRYLCGTVEKVLVLRPVRGNQITAYEAANRAAIGRRILKVAVA